MEAMPVSRVRLPPFPAMKIEVGIRRKIRGSGEANTHDDSHNRNEAKEQ